MLRITFYQKCLITLIADGSNMNMLLMRPICYWGVFETDSIKTITLVNTEL